MASLLVGPLLRHVGSTDATMWVETDAPCEVSVLGQLGRTFTVRGHHYALVVLTGLEPGSTTAYDVALDGTTVWPPADSSFPPSVIRTLRPGQDLRILFGSCRFAAPHEPPWTLSPDDDEHGHGFDALRSYALQVRDQPVADWPDLVLHIGDQVYADEVSPQALEFLRGRRNTNEPPGEEVADFEEYTRLYWESWQEPVVRWLLSTVPSAMLFDDHDVRDDWNISESWVQEMRALTWWEDRITGAFMSYWVYQHLGNLSPAALATDSVWQEVQQADDAGAVLEAFARRADREVRGARWSFARAVGGTLVLGIDCRAGRVLRDGRRSMLDDEEWDWLADEVRSGDWDHVLLALPDPLLLAEGAHHLQAWDEAVTEGRWGRWFVRYGEKLRRGLDLDHWASFHDGFVAMIDLIRKVGSQAAAPATITALSGDVHHAFLAEVEWPAGTPVRSRVYQAVCSPLRNPLSRKERAAQKFTGTRTGIAIGRALARLAGVPPPPVRWRFVRGPVFGNQIATVRTHGRSASFSVQGVGADGRLAPSFDYELA